jgi:hypothetical protein
MFPESNPQTPDEKTAEAGTLSIEVDPSPSFILAVSQLFRSYNQPQQAVELCRRGLTLFPGNLGLRLTMAMGLGDLQQKEQAWAEIEGVAQEIHQWSAVLEKIAQFSLQNEQPRFAEWFARLSQVLAKSPTEAPPASTPSVPAKVEEARGSGREEPVIVPEGEPGSDSNVLSTLNDWLSQLKKD